MAQIALEIARTRAKNPRSLKLEDFILTKEQPKQQVTPIEKSKSFWKGLIQGITK